MPDKPRIYNTEHIFNLAEYDEWMNQPFTIALQYLSAFIISLILIGSLCLLSCLS